MIDGGTNNIYYIHKDYLGSFESITDDNGVLLERSSYDPWGRRRNATDWTFNNVGYSMFDRGYTGHQHLDVFELVNMNGRVYDPWLGRFLSPDPFVQAPTYSQNYNRYSYVLNNPLKYIDPSGYHYEEYAEGTGPTGGSSHYNYGSDDFGGGHADSYNSWRMNFQQSISTNLNYVTSNLMSSKHGGTWSWTGGYAFFKSSAIDGDAYSYGYAYNTHHKSWEYTEVKDKKVIYNLNHGLAWNAGRGNTGTGLSYSGNNNLVTQEGLGVNLLTSSNPISDILEQVKHVSSSKDINNLFDIILLQRYTKIGESSFQKYYKINGHRYRLMVAPFDERIDLNYYNVYKWGIGYLSRFEKFEETWEYWGGYAYGFYMVGYDRQNLIYIGANTQEGFDYLRLIYEKF